MCKLVIPFKKISHICIYKTFVVYIIFKFGNMFVFETIFVFDNMFVPQHALVAGSAASERQYFKAHF